jgi:hypothetical protein
LPCFFVLRSSATSSASAERMNQVRIGLMPRVGVSASTNIKYTNTTLSNATAK